MSDTILAHGLGERPLPCDKRNAKRLFTAWHGALEPEARANFDRLRAGADDLDGFLAAVFDGSPYLAGLAMRDPDRLVRVLARTPEATLDAVLHEGPADIDGDDATFQRALRLAKQEAALAIALADLGGLWPVAAVTEALTRTAEWGVATALDRLVRREVGRGRIRTDTPEDPVSGCGYFVLGMGKLGARELNFSSDVDLICFYDRDKVRLKDEDEHQAVFVRVTQGLAKLVGERTFDGVFFRVDLRLRPDPGTYPVAISTRLAEHYYEALGQTWERAAMIKARPIAGDLDAGEAFLKDIRPFVWRRYLDYAALADVHAMKRQIHAVKGHETVAVEGHDLKLGRGGIREIEFFVQTQQLIGGGRNPALRARETVPMLDALKVAGWIGDKPCRDLQDAYRLLRRLEHRVQMVADEQTHALPADEKVLQAFARFAGYANRAALAKDLGRTLDTVQRHYAQLFEDAPRGSIAGRLDFAGTGEAPETKSTLRTLGFARPEEAIATVRAWLSGRFPATRTQGARERLAEILPRLLEALAATGEADEALAAFDRFLTRQPAGVQLFSLLRSNPVLLDLAADVLGKSPRMARLLAHRPRVLEGMIETLHAPGLDPLADVTERLSAQLAEAGILEEALDLARVFTQEQMFLIGVRLLGGQLAIGEAGAAFSRLAQAVVRDLHARLHREHVGRYGRTPKDVSAIVALGKFGSGEMTASSDLDLLLLYDDPFDAPSDGARSLYATEYYTRLTQRLVAALSAPTAQGVLYAVDFRLRPSGNKGPLATTLASFRDYQEGEAWTWEHMALTRARVVSAPAAFAGRIAETIRAVLTKPRDAAKLTADVVDMRRVIAKEKPAIDPWDVKTRHGGLIDVEFLAQWLALRDGAAHPELIAGGTLPILEAARAAGRLARADADALIAAARFYHALTQILRLTLDEAFVPERAPRGLPGVIARAVGLPDIARVAAELQETSATVARIARRLWGADPYAPPKG